MTKISIVVISKDEASLHGTLARLEPLMPDPACEIVVVDASFGRLDAIRRAHKRVRWLDYIPPANVRVSIPQQRNYGVEHAVGDVVVFIDSGCSPRAGWLECLVEPILTEGEMATCGPAVGSGSVYHGPGFRVDDYVNECPTLNFAFRVEAYHRIGGFDESFEYGSDIDFTWRLVDAGFRLRYVRDAVIEHDWGGWRRRLRRSYLYGRARARLYQKHQGRLSWILAEDPLPVVYPLFLIGLPVTLRFRFYPLLLLIPIWRNRRMPNTCAIVADHLVQGIGVIGQLTGFDGRRR